MFDNSTMRTPIKGKPHIQLIDGYWRVNRLRRNYESLKWQKAHAFVFARNEARIKGM